MPRIALILNAWHELWITANQNFTDIKDKWHCLATKGHVGRSEKRVEIPDEAEQFSVRSQRVEPTLQPSFLPTKCGRREMFSFVPDRPAKNSSPPSGADVYDRLQLELYKKVKVRCIILFFKLRTAAFKAYCGSGLDLPTSATRRLHACHHARAPSGGRWNCGRECQVILPKCQLPPYI